MNAMSEQRRGPEIPATLPASSESAANKCRSIAKRILIRGETRDALLAAADAIDELRATGNTLYIAWSEANAACHASDRVIRDQQSNAKAAQRTIAAQHDELETLRSIVARVILATNEADIELCTDCKSDKRHCSCLPF